MAGPSLPTSYSQALDGIERGPSVGSCGTAAFFGKAIEVTDIATDPLWDDFRGLALPLGLRACWSSPIKARDGRTIGTFAFYFREPRGSNALERLIVDRCTHLCSILIENDTARKLIHDQAFVDSLSGLPNRAEFDIQLSLQIASDQPFALLFADLDHLKVVNDTLGHAAGDKLIGIVAGRLSTALPEASAFRLGGDEFALIVRGCVSDTELGVAANIVIQSVNLPVDYDGITITPSVTIGAVLANAKSVDKRALYQNADFALYHAKEVGRGSFVRFREGMRTTMTQRLNAIAQVEEALSQNRVVAYYQPLVRIDTAEIIGLEALARISDHAGNVIAAAEFGSALTDPRLASGLTAAMIQQVARDIRSWLNLGIPFQHVGFNVTTADLQRGDLEAKLADAFAQYAVPLKHLILEVNEAVLMNDDRVAREIKCLRARGMKVALDDFGTGYASLTHLLQFPVDIIKIDKSFVDRIDNDAPGAVIVKALIEIAKQLDIKVVAEGIETIEQADRLNAMGCLLGQGYLYSRPVPASVATGLLTRFAQRQANSRHVETSKRKATGG